MESEEIVWNSFTRLLVVVSKIVFLIHGNNISAFGERVYMRYWPSLFGQDGWIFGQVILCFFIDRDEAEVHKSARKEKGQYPAILTEQAWSIKDLFYGQRFTSLRQNVSLLREQSGQSRGGKIGPSCPLG